MTHAVLQWDANAHEGKRPLVIAENVTAESAVIIAGMNKDQYKREIVNMDKLESILHGLCDLHTDVLTA